MCKEKHVDVQYAFERNPIWRFKLHLQHTGWLQYIPPFVLGSLFRVVSRGIAYCFHTTTATYLASYLATIAKLLCTIGIFDIITLKLNIRPPEPLPKRLQQVHHASKEKNRCDIDIYSAVLQRHSCRSFQPRKLIPKHREELLQIAKIMSTEHRTIGTAPIRFEYVNAPLKVWPVVNAREFLVAIVGPCAKCYDRTAMIDVGRSLQTVILYATAMGLGTCWIGPGADHDSILAALGGGEQTSNSNSTHGGGGSSSRFDGDRDQIVCVCAIGYKSSLVPFMLRCMRWITSRSRKPCRELFFADDRFTRPLDFARHPFDTFEKCYEAARWSPSSFNAQPTLCRGTNWNVKTAGSISSSISMARYDFFSSTKSRYYAPIAAGIWLCDWEVACKSIGTRGRFAVLTDRERGVDDSAGPLSLPVYNISWIQMPMDAK